MEDHKSHGSNTKGYSKLIANSTIKSVDGDYKLIDYFSLNWKYKEEL